MIYTEIQKLLLQNIYTIVIIQTFLTQMSKVIRKKMRNREVENSKELEAPPEYSQVQQDTSSENNVLAQQRMQLQKQNRVNQTTSNNKLKNIDEETVGGQSVSDSLPRPYEFLKFANPKLHMIFVPHFSVKTLNFGLSIILIVCFIALIVYSYTKPVQNKLTWNCSIFELQNKYFPRVRYQYQFWRIPVSFFFHSNIAHFILNVIGLQIYGYFVQWYYGKIKYVVSLVIAGILGFVMSCAALPTTVSTTPSSFLFAILALKLIFLYEYRNYKALLNRRVLIYLLFALILGINLIPIFVNNNIDFTNHISGFLAGLLIGIFIYIHKKQQQTRCEKAVKFLGIIFLIIGIVVCFALMFALPDLNENYLALNQNISAKCNDPNQQ